MKTIAAIQARLGSTRLPNKVLADLGGLPMVFQIARRLEASEAIDEVIIATTTAPSDAPLVEACQARGIGVHRGAVDDLVARLYGAACAFEADVLVRVWGDCPCVDPEVVTHTVAALKGGEKLFASTMRPPGRTLPLGLDVEVYTRACLSQILAQSDDPFYREFPVEFINRELAPERIGGYRYPDDVSTLQITVDYPEDLTYARALYHALDRPGRIFNVADLIAWMTSDAGVAAQPSDLARNSDYLTKKATHAGLGPKASAS